MQASLSSNQLVGIAVALSTIPNEKRRRQRKIWAKDLFLQRPRVRETGISEVLESDDFKLMRITPDAFYKLLKMVRPLIKKNNTVMREAVTEEERLIITLRHLATGKSYADLQNSTAVSPSLMTSVIRETCDAIYLSLKSGIKMPTTEQQWLEVADGFEKKWNFPHCLGSFDGIHVAINKPAHSGAIFLNYKGYPSVVLLALVDANYQFMYLNTGANGSASGSTVFENTIFYQKYLSGKLNLPKDSPLPGMEEKVPYVFLGDCAFSLDENCMNTFPVKNIDHPKRIFNYRLSRVRNLAENTLGILTSRFRVLRQISSVKLDTIDSIVLACCSLHNYLSKNNPSYLDDGVTVDYEDLQNIEFRPGEWRLDNKLVPLCHKSIRNRFQEGDDVRQIFVDYFNSVGSVPFQEDMLKVIPEG